MKVTTVGRSIFLATALFIGSHAVSFEASATGTLSPQKCEFLRSEYDKLAAKYGESRKIVRLAKAVLDKYCPVQPPPVDEPNECIVQGIGGNYPLGIDSFGFLTNSASPAKVVCTTSSACLNIASQVFGVVSTSPTARCADLNSADVVRYNDVELQSKINELP